MKRFFELTGEAKQQYIERYKKRDWPEYRERLKQLLAHCKTDRYANHSHPLVQDYVGAVANEGQTVEGLKPSKDRPEYLVPNMRTKAGKELKKWMNSVRVPSLDWLAEMLGFKPVGWDGNKCYSFGLSDFGEMGVYIILPDCAEYRAYTPHYDLTEIKEWIYLKNKDEWELAKSKNQPTATL